MNEYFYNGTSIKKLSSKGPFLIFVHGLGLNKNMWEWQVKKLSSNYSIITYDLYGHGESYKNYKSHNLKLFSNQINDILNFFEIEKTALFGFSLGGMIARRFAIDHSEKLWALGILNSAHKRDHTARMAVQKRVDLVKKHGPSITVENALERWFTEKFRQNNLGTMNLIKDWVLANDKKAYPKSYQVLLDGVDELLDDKLPISCPTLILTGDEDYGNSPDMSKAISKQISGSTLKILPGLRHMALIEDHEQVNSVIINFLKNILFMQGEDL